MKCRLACASPACRGGGPTRPCALVVGALTCYPYPTPPYNPSDRGSYRSHAGDRACHPYDKGRETKRLVRGSHRDAPRTPNIGDPSKKKANKTTECTEKCTVIPLSPRGHEVAKSGPTRQLKPLKLRLTGHVARRRCEEAEFYIWDTELPGFGLRFRPSGGKRWFLRYVERGRARVWTIGKVSEICAEYAREAARKRLREVALLGLPKKPMPVNAAVKVSTFVDLVEHFLADRPFAWKPSTEFQQQAVPQGRLGSAFWIDGCRCDTQAGCFAMARRAGGAFRGIQPGNRRPKWCHAIRRAVGPSEKGFQSGARYAAFQAGGDAALS